jgi:mono/diheme cytochrome c family protein
MALAATAAAIVVVVAPAETRREPTAAVAGRLVYDRDCGLCHGSGLEGQPNWQKPNAAGRLPAPPLDATGHAWQHDDAELRHMIEDGFADISPPGYVSDMPAFAGRVSDAEIAALLAYVKSRWPTQLRNYQAMLNPGGMRSIAWSADWRFPASCRDSRLQSLTAAKQTGG